MAKYYGMIGFGEEVETAPGVVELRITERPYYGDIIRNTRRLQPTDQLNDNVSVANEISIVSDPFAVNHIYSMRYVEFMGAKWKVSNVEVQYPRLILSLGGLWNGQQA